VLLTDWQNEKNQKQNFNSQTKLSGKEWAQSFLRWRDFRFGNPEPTVVTRILASNIIKVTQIYDNSLAVFDVHGVLKKYRTFGRQKYIY
jgi:hypothetical protein